MELLNVSSNLLTGRIPDSFLLNCDQDKKIHVDISNNLLTGTVPYDLQKFNRLSLQAKQNRLTGIDPELCRREGWNDYDVQAYGCDGILCPAGTFNELGRRSSDGSSCQSCGRGGGAKYMGSTACSGGGAFMRIASWSLAVALAMTGFIMQ
jgi:hypothetical protein